MRNKKLHRKLLLLREVARRRRLTSGERAIATFIERYTAEDEPARDMGLIGGRADEDEGNGLVCTNCGEDEHEDEAKFCASCGGRLKPVEDERQSRADETEGRKGREPDSNDLGFGGYRGHDEQKRSERIGKADEAAKEFRSQYRRLSEAKSFSADRASAATIRTGF